MTEDNRPLINKIFNPYPNLPGFKGFRDLGRGGKRYLVGSDKGLSSYFKDYTDPNITIGETIAKGLGSGADALLETGLGVYDTALRIPQGIMSAFTAKSPFAGDYVNYADDDYEQLENEEDYLKTVQNPEINKLLKDLSKKTGRATIKSDNVEDTTTTNVATTDTTDKADETPAVSEQDKLDELFTSALQSAADAREGQPTKRKTLEDYKKEFSEATGIDASGKVDKSGALMALGLALMQNKAGKGFNVGNMLSAVGEAGEKALPVFEKAKQQAKLAAAKAGEYALGKVAEDDAKAKLEQEEMLNREQYYVVPKGEKGGPMGVVNSVLSGDGEFVRVNKFELAKLDENQEFNDKFEIVKASEYNDILKEAMKTPEAKENWSGKIQKMEFFKGHDYDLSYYAPKSPDLGLKPMLVNPGVALNELTRLEQGLQQSEGRFKELANLISATDVTVPAQVRKTVVQISRNLGLPISSETDPVKQIDVLLKEISALSAAEILGETGKTLSDSDRLRVDQIVGTLSFSEADPQVLITKLDRLFDVVVGNRRRDITQFRNNLQTFGNPELKGYFQQGQQSQNQNIDFDAVDKIVG